MEIRKLDPSNPADAEILNTIDDELYQGNEDDFEEDDGLYHADDELDHDMEDDEHRRDYINKLNEQ